MPGPCTISAIHSFVLAHFDSGGFFYPGIAKVINEGTHTTRKQTNGEKPVSLILFNARKYRGSRKKIIIDDTRCTCAACNYSKKSPESVDLLWMSQGLRNTSTFIKTLSLVDDAHTVTYLSKPQTNMRV